MAGAVRVMDGFGNMRARADPSFPAPNPPHSPTNLTPGPATAGPLERCEAS